MSQPEPGISALGKLREDEHEFKSTLFHKENLLQKPRTCKFIMFFYVHIVTKMKSSVYEHVAKMRGSCQFLRKSALSNIENGPKAYTNEGERVSKYNILVNHLE